MCIFHYRLKDHLFNTDGDYFIQIIPFKTGFVALGRSREGLCIELIDSGPFIRVYGSAIRKVSRSIPGLVFAVTGFGLQKK